MLYLYDFIDIGLVLVQYSQAAIEQTKLHDDAVYPGCLEYRRQKYGTIGLNTLIIHVVNCLCVIVYRNSKHVIVNCIFVIIHHTSRMSL